MVGAFWKSRPSSGWSQTQKLDIRHCYERRSRNQKTAEPAGPLNNDNIDIPSPNILATKSLDPPSGFPFAVDEKIDEDLHDVPLFFRQPICHIQVSIGIQENILRVVDGLLDTSAGREDG